MAEERVSKGSDGTAIATRAEPGSESHVMGELAGRSYGEDHLAAGVTAIADAVGDGQPGRTQNCGDGFMDVQSGDHAVVHTALWFMAEHVRIGAADHQAQSLGRSASKEDRADHQLVRSDSERME